MSAIAARLRPSRHSARVLGYMTIPVGLLICFFVAPLIVLADKSFRFELIAEKTGFTLDNYTRIFGNHLYVHILLQTIEIATIAMAVELLIAVPLAYVLAFKAGKFEIPLLSWRWYSPTSSTRWSASTPGACCSARKGSSTPRSKPSASSTTRSTHCYSVASR